MSNPKPSSGFKKGNLGKQKGAVNKVTQTAREMFVDILEKQVPKIEAAFEEVYNKDKQKYLELYGKYAQYFIPRKVDVTTQDKPIEQVFNIGGQEIKF